MADNPSIDPGTSPTVPVEGDDIGGGVIRQGVVLSWGAKDASVRATAAAPLPVVDATGNTGLGAPADAAWTSGNGSIIAVLKGIFGKVAGTLSISGAVTGSGVFHVDDNAGSLTVDGTVGVSGNVATTSAAASQSDGHSATIGALADTSSANTLVGLLKAIKAAVTGTIAVSGTFFQATQPVSQANPVQAATATLATVAGSASSGTLQASNGARKGLVIVNDSTAILYVKFGSAASSSSYTYFLAGSVSGVPATLELPAMVYTGIVTGIWASATGNARITELT